MQNLLPYIADYPNKSINIYILPGALHLSRTLYLRWPTESDARVGLTLDSRPNNQVPLPLGCQSSFIAPMHPFKLTISEITQKTLVLYNLPFVMRSRNWPQNPFCVSVFLTLLTPETDLLPMFLSLGHAPKIIFSTCQTRYLCVIYKNYNTYSVSWKETPNLLLYHAFSIAEESEARRG